MIKPNQKSSKQYLLVFTISFIVSLLFFLPFIIMDKGMFIYYGDFNVQQIPFYRLCHDAIRNGNIFWNWETDLGVNFISSYSFYTLGSPFFWLTIPFPTEALPYLMAPLLMLKFAVSSLTSFAFLKRFVKNPNYALIGSLLYSFSGFSIYNIFFNHFQDVIAFFPLLLLALEENVVNRRRGVFALAVALSAVINYYFFFGEVIFVVLYFFARLASKGNFKLNIKQFLLLFSEAVIGVLISAFILLPSILSVMSNPRTGNFLLGWNGLFYGNVQRYGLILQSLFYPPDIPAYPNFFPDSNAKWSSVSLYLPLFSMTGVFAMLKAKVKHFTKPLFFSTLIFAFIPFLNSAFSAFNRSYYARWFYMPILIMSLMTVIALEKYRENFKFGIKWTAIISSIFIVISFFPSYNGDELEFFKLPKYQDRLWAYVMIVIMGIVLTYFITKIPQRIFFNVTSLCLCGMIILTSVLMISLGKCDETTKHRVVEMGLNGKENFSFVKYDSEEFYRIDMYNNTDDNKKCMDNFPMFWQIPTIQAFHSVVPGSIFTFYDSIGFKRDVGSRAGINYKGLRALTSVKYMLTYHNEKDADTEGFTYLTTENEFDIYRNNSYIPMGFTYDYYVDKVTFNNFNEKDRDRLMVSALYLNKKQVIKYKDILTLLPEEKYPVLTNEGLKADAAKRRENVCYKFTTDNKGFSAAINTPTPELVFFSVPYENGWSATVNGKEVEVENVNNGFMAVKVPAGESEIRFDYKTPGLRDGIIITIISLILLSLYVLIMKKLSPKYPDLKFKPQNHKNNEISNIHIAASEAYATTISQSINPYTQIKSSLNEKNAKKFDKKG